MLFSELELYQGLRDFPEAQEQLLPCATLVENTKKWPKLGCTKFGGQPHLSKQTKWPKINDREASFVLQINLAEIEAEFLNPLLPKTGLLSFFVHSLFGNEAENADFDYDKPNCKILYTANTHDLIRKKYPKVFLTQQFRIEKERKVIGKKEINLSDFDGENQLEPPKLPDKNASSEEKEIYKRKLDAYLLKKYGAGQDFLQPVKVQTQNYYLNQYEEVLHKKYFYPYDFPFDSRYSAFGEELLTKEGADGICLDLMPNLSIANFDYEESERFANGEKLSKIYQEEWQKNVNESAGMFGGHGYSVQSFRENYQNIRNYLSTFYKQEIKDKIVHLLTLNEPVDELYGTTMSFFVCQKDLEDLSFKKVWVSMDCD